MRFTSKHRGFHQLRQTRISHHLCVNAITVHTRLEHDVGEQYRLAGLGFDSARKRHSHFDVQIVPGTLTEFERAVLSPDFASLLRPAAIVVQVLLRKRYYKSINIMSHGYSLVVLLRLVRTALLPANLLQWDNRPPRA